MASTATTLQGVVKNGVIVPETPVALPEGARVTILLSGASLPPELQAELAAWDRAGDEAWRMIETEFSPFSSAISAPPR